MKPKVPKDEEEYMKMLKMAFKQGQKHTKAIHRTSEWSDVDDEDYSIPSCTFEHWANHKWKYGLIQLHLLNDI